MSALSAIDLVKRYSDGKARREVVSHVSLEVAKGAFIALSGPSGSGKTTLLGLFAGVIAPTSGDVHVLSKSIVEMRDHHRTLHRRRSIGIVFQDYGLIGHMTALENALVPFVPEGGGSDADHTRVASLFQRFGVGEHQHRRAELLSGGEKQRVALIRALALDPPILLLDEPTAHLDEERSSDVVTLLRELHDEGRTIVMSTHDPRVYNSPLIDRVLTMTDGKLVR